MDVRNGLSAVQIDEACELIIPRVGNIVVVLEGIIVSFGEDWLKNVVDNHSKDTN